MPLARDLWTAPANGDDRYATRSARPIAAGFPDVFRLSVLRNMAERRRSG